MALTDAMVALYSTTLAAATTQVSITGIPSTGYKDLVLVMEASTTADGVTVDIQFNNDAGVTYAWSDMGARNNGTFSGFDSQNQFRIFGNTFGTVPCQITMSVLDFNATDKHKSTLVSGGSYDTALSSYIVKRHTGRWYNVNPVSSIQISSYYNSRSFAIGSKFSLYGIKA